MKLSELQNKNIAVWGFGVEGRACADYLFKNLIDFSVLCNESEVDRKYKCITEKVTTQVLNDFDVIIKSPGISPYSDFVQSSRTTFTSPTALWFANEKNTNVIAVTGTKGKSTTVSLLTHILKSLGKNVNLVGNIGHAIISSDSNYDYIILEASSFQIYDGNINADIVLITNLYPEHVDWHHGQENYFNDKLKILDSAKNKIVNAKNSRLMNRISDDSYITFNHPFGFNVLKNDLFFEQKLILSLSEIKLIGQHNLENIGAVLTVCKQLKLDMNVCVEAIKLFEPLAHRLENLGKIGKHYAINDSIATTPIATLAALQTVDLEKTTLFVGGFDRGNDWTKFAESLNKMPPNLLLISGQNGEIIFNHLNLIKATFNYKLFDNLSAAISYSKKHTPKNNTLLLSPGAPSFDQFDSYIERGDFFQQELKKYAP